MVANWEDGIADEVVDQLLEVRDRATVFDSGGWIDELKKRLAERMLNAELDHHLGRAKGAGGGESPQRGYPRQSKPLCKRNGRNCNAATTCAMP